MFVTAARESRVPIIAAVTGGLELALSCDFIIASERARFADTHLRVGVYPGPVMVELPRRIGMARAREMSLTGNFVDAAEARRIGLANHVVPHDQLVDFALQMASDIAEQEPSMVAIMRQDWNSTAGLPIAEAHELHIQYAREGGFAEAEATGIASHHKAVMQRAKLGG